MDEEKQFLGRGWAFPPSFDLQNGTVEMAAEVADINQSLEILLSTSLGERVMLPEYGCNLRDYQFESMNASLIGFLRDLVETAILYYEPRILVEKIEISESTSQEAIQGILLISVDYIVRNTNSRFNFVFPFYRNEAVGEITSITQSR